MIHLFFAMFRHVLTLLAFFFLLGVAVSADEPITVKSEVNREAVAWPPPSVAVVRRELVDWLGVDELDDEFDAANLSGASLLEDVVKTMREHSPPVAEYLDACDAMAWQELPFGKKLVLPKVPLHIFVGDAAGRFLHGALRQVLAERLVQARLYDEALSILEEMSPENCIDPAGVLLLKAVVCHHLSLHEPGRAAIQSFYKTVEHKTTEAVEPSVAENDAAVPRRRMELAKLLEWELTQQSGEQNESQQISRKMNDIRRRLGKGKTDEGTQEAEKDVMKSLDKLIEKIEEQAKKQGEAAESDQGRQGNKPADDSRILKQKGPGNVDRREFDPDGNWGELAPKEREEALLKIEKDFPPHYRDVIERYFKEMATERTDY